jgi:hypothetical protein
VEREAELLADHIVGDAGWAVTKQSEKLSNISKVRDDDLQNVLRSSANWSNRAVTELESANAELRND